ncbi:hypothetical protein B0H13DRAFT_1854698 [Mycena leptocephala]|nr:hypothetical protein B0H13DRAFT_1854698 [Mycena leptocephala]
MSSPVVIPKGEDMAPDTTVGASAAFVSARSSASPQKPTPSEATSFSSGERTSPLMPGVKFKVDVGGIRYVVHPASGPHFDIPDDTAFTRPIEDSSAVLGTLNLLSRGF